MKPSHRQAEYDRLRKQHAVFVYHGYSVHTTAHGLSVEYDFEIPGLVRFHPTIKVLERSFLSTANLTAAELDNLVFHIGMVELVSYWKTTCAPTVIIEPHVLDEAQIAWWKKLYFHGLGEFFYLNDITPNLDDFMTINVASSLAVQSLSSRVGTGTLLPVGGGKDSVVTLELLKKGGIPFRPFIINPRGATIRTSEIAGFDLDECIVVMRALDTALLRLNEQGYLNGHTPFSALLGFTTLLAACLAGYNDIALSNEGSANEATIKGTQINHQYSKSFEFETDLRNYINSYISKDLSYFSFLRPLQEIQIASVFSRYPKYFGYFKSCNAGSKTDSWCGVCAKCLFAFIILSPFIEEDQMCTIFGRDLLDDLSMQGYFDELAGISENKPFECIGTIDEVNLSLQLIAKKRKLLPALLKHYEQHKKCPVYSVAEIDALLHRYDEHHYLSATYLSLIKEALNA